MASHSLIKPTVYMNTSMKQKKKKLQLRPKDTKPWHKVPRTALFIVKLQERALQRDRELLTLTILKGEKDSSIVWPLIDTKTPQLSKWPHLTLLSPHFHSKNNTLQNRKKKSFFLSQMARHGLHYPRHTDMTKVRSSLFH